jgi:putative pyruvate formate lyase activating enzyme
MFPSYLNLIERGEFEERVKNFLNALSSCELCPRACRVNRLKNEKGKCETGRFARVSSYNPHFGEEAPLVGYRGSGTIFFTWCNLKCVFCQNYEISQLGEGVEVTPDELADIMLDLQRMGCHNINLVSPTHVIAQVIEALRIAAWKGLNLPIVYNTGGYDSIKTLRMLEGIIDIYMPDMKYGDNETAFKYSGIEGYFDVNKRAVKEMHRQTGDLIIDERGIARRGLIIRHLVLPNGLANSEKVIKFIAEELSKNTYLNIMDQYRPCYRADEYPELSRRITNKEWEEVVRLALKYGIKRIDGVRI